MSDSRREMTDLEREKSRIIELLFDLKGQALVSDYSCAISEQILFHGRLYVTEDAICFSSDLFGKQIRRVLKFERITSISKKYTAFVIPSLEVLVTSHRSGEEKRVIFSSFFSSYRDDCYNVCLQQHRLRRPDLYVEGGEPLLTDKHAQARTHSKPSRGSVGGGASGRRDGSSSGGALERRSTAEPPRARLASDTASATPPGRSTVRSRAATEEVLLKDSRASATAADARHSIGAPSLELHEPLVSRGSRTPGELPSEAASKGRLLATDEKLRGHLRSQPRLGAAGPAAASDESAARRRDSRSIDSAPGTTTPRIAAADATEIHAPNEGEGDDALSTSNARSSSSRPRPPLERRSSRSVGSRGSTKRIKISSSSSSSGKSGMGAGSASAPSTMQGLLHEDGGVANGSSASSSAVNDHRTRKRTHATASTAAQSPAADDSISPLPLHIDAPSPLPPPTSLDSSVELLPAISPSSTQSSPALSTDDGGGGAEHRKRRGSSFTTEISGIRNVVSSDDEGDEGDDDDAADSDAGGASAISHQLSAVGNAHCNAPPSTVWQRLNQMSVILDVVIPLTVSAFYDAFISNTAYYPILEFHKALGHSGITATAWSDASPQESAASASAAPAAAVGAGNVTKGRAPVNSTGAVIPSATTTNAATATEGGEGDNDNGGEAGKPPSSSAIERASSESRSIRLRMTLEPQMFAPVDTAVEKSQSCTVYRGPVLVVDTAARSPDVPFGNYFLTEDTWVVTPVDPSVSIPIAGHEYASRAEIDRALRALEDLEAGVERERGSSSSSSRTRRKLHDAAAGSTTSGRHGGGGGTSTSSLASMATPSAGSARAPSASSHPKLCRLVVLLRINFSKSTMLKGTITGKAEVATTNFHKDWLDSAVSRLPALFEARALSRRARRHQLQGGGGHASAPADLTHESAAAGGVRTRPHPQRRLQRYPSAEEQHPASARARAAAAAAMSAAQGGSGAAGGGAGGTQAAAAAAAAAWMANATSPSAAAGMNQRDLALAYARLFDAFAASVAAATDGDGGPAADAPQSFDASLGSRAGDTNEPFPLLHPSDHLLVKKSFALHRRHGSSMDASTAAAGAAAGGPLVERDASRHRQFSLLFERWPFSSPTARLLVLLAVLLPLVFWLGRVTAG